MFVPSRRGGGVDAFTLVELLTVILIIAILAALTLAAGEGVMTQAARSRTRAEIQAMSAALESYKADNGVYPQSLYNGTGDNTTYKSADGSAAGGAYANSAKILYQNLAGKINFTDATFTGGAGKGYMTFKLDQVSGTTATYVQDPFGYSYGYNTGDAANPQVKVPYNGTGLFDLWSTGGALSTATPPDPTPVWISNWAH